MARSARNAEYTKDYNRKLFLRLLRTGPLSRSEIARRIGLTRAATSLIAEEMIEGGYVRETIATDKPLGRNPVPLQLIGSAAYAVGIYLNRSGCRAGIVDMRGRVLAQTELAQISPEHMDLLSQAISRMIEAHGIPKEKVVGAGISAPGPLDGENGKILNPPGFEVWHHVDITRSLRSRLDMPVYLANDAACMAQYCLGKKETGGSENYLLLLVDSGVGSGVVIRGKTLKGAGFFTGELGHTSIDLNGRPCICGNNGCLEAYASIPNLLRGSCYSTWKQVMDGREDALAKELFQREMDYLTVGIVNMANLVSIDTVLLAGDLLYRADLAASALEKQINQRLLRREIMPIRVLPSCSGPDVPIQSAAELAFDWFLRA